MEDNLFYIDNNIFIIARDLKRYQQIKDGLDYFVNNDVLFYPQWDCVPYDRISPNKLITSKRLETLSILSNGECKNKIILTTIQASCQRTLSINEIKNKFISLKPGEIVDIDNLLSFFVNNGYTKTSTVREHGEFSIRGGIIDFFSPLNTPQLVARTAMATKEMSLRMRSCINEFGNLFTCSSTS